MINSAHSPDYAIKENLKSFTWERDNWRFSMWNEEAVKEMDKYTTDKRVLDLGCGDGVAIDQFIKMGYKCIGVDINGDKLKRVNAPTSCADFLTYLNSIKDNSVPNIFCHHALEHVPNPQDVLKEVARVLKPGGIWFCIVPYEHEKESPYDTHFTLFGDAEELLPPGLEVIKKDLQMRETKEHLMIATK